MPARLLPLRPAGRTRSMWGLVCGYTSSTGSFVGGMDSLKRRGKVVHHGFELGPQRRRPSHQHIIVASAKRLGRGNANQFTQAPPHAVAFHGIADLLGDRESDARWTTLGAPARLQDEGACRCACASCGTLGGGPKVTPAFQPLHETDIRTVLNRNGDSAPVTRRFRLKHSISYGRARGERPKPYARPWSPCGCENHGGACVPICSADRSVSRDISAAGYPRCAAACQRP